jgi:hypothetical protein
MTSRPIEASRRRNIAYVWSSQVVPEGARPALRALVVGTRLYVYQVISTLRGNDGDILVDLAGVVRVVGQCGPDQLRRHAEVLRCPVDEVRAEPLVVVAARVEPVRQLVTDVPRRQEPEPASGRT